MENYEKRYRYIKEQGFLSVTPDIGNPWFPSSVVYKACGLQKASRKKIRASTIYRCKEARVVIRNNSHFLAKETLTCFKSNNLQKGKGLPKPNPPVFTAKGAMKALGFKTRQAFYKSREYKDYLLHPGRFFVVSKPLGKNKLSISFYDANSVYALQKTYIRYYAFRIAHSNRDAYNYENFLFSTMDTTCPTCGKWGVKLDDEEDSSGNLAVLCPNCGKYESAHELTLHHLSVTMKYFSF